MDLKYEKLKYDARMFFELNHNDSLLGLWGYKIWLRWPCLENVFGDLLFKRLKEYQRYREPGSYRFSPDVWARSYLRMKMTIIIKFLRSLIDLRTTALFFQIKNAA
jgi:hypothetical protein